MTRNSRKILVWGLWSALCLVQALVCEQLPLINTIDLTDHAVRYYFNNKLVDAGYVLSDCLVIKYTDEIVLTELDETIITAPLILFIAPIVWLSNQNFTIKKMDEDLFYSLIKIKKVFKFFWPEKQWLGEIVPGALVKNRTKEPRISVKTECALLFSHGLDAVASALIHYDEKPLLLTCITQQYSNLQEEKIFRRQVNDFKKVYGHEGFFLSSNFDLVINDRRIKEEFRDTINWSMALSGLVFPILHITGIQKLIIASTHALDHPYPWGSHPLIDNAIAVAGTRVMYDTPYHSRINKVEAIVRLCNQKELPLPLLQVCFHPKNGINCGACEKCLRTMNEVLAAGNDPGQFGFNVQPREIIRTTYAFLQNALKIMPNSARVVINTFWVELRNFVQQGTYRPWYESLDKEYFAWLASLPLSQKYAVLSSKREVYTKFHDVLAGLWNQAADRILDYNSLQNILLV